MFPFNQFLTHFPPKMFPFNQFFIHFPQKMFPFNQPFSPIPPNAFYSVASTFLKKQIVLFVLSCYKIDIFIRYKVKLMNYKTYYGKVVSTLPNLFKVGNFVSLEKRF